MQLRQVSPGFEALQLGNRDTHSLPFMVTNTSLMFPKLAPVKDIRLPPIAEPMEGVTGPVIEGAQYENSVFGFVRSPAVVTTRTSIFFPAPGAILQTIEGIES